MTYRVLVKPSNPYQAWTSRGGVRIRVGRIGAGAAAGRALCVRAGGGSGGPDHMERVIGAIAEGHE